MNEQEKRELARRLADASSVLDFSSALRLVRSNPRKVELRLKARERSHEQQAALSRSRERLRLAGLR